MSLLWSPPYQQLFNSNTEEPEALAEAELYFYQAGTTNNLTVYQNNELSTPHSQPVEADSAGRFPPIYLPVVETYKVVLKDGDGNTIWTADNVPGTSEEAAALTSAIPSTPVVSKVDNYTVLASDLGRVINCNPSGGAFTITLISAVTATDGQRVTIRHIGSANQVKITTVSSQTISRSGDAATTAFSLVGYGESVTLVADGGNWHVVAYAPPLISATTGVIKIKDRISSTPSPDPGDRYIVTSAFSTFEEGDIIEYSGTGSVYIEYTPPTNCGWIAYVQDEAINYQFRSTAWVPDVASDTVAGRIEIAVQAEMETPSSVLLAVTPGRQHFHQGHPKAGGNLNGTGTPAFAAGDYGMGAVTDNGTGDYTFAFDTAFSNTNYWATAFARGTSGTEAAFCSAQTGDIKTTSTFQVIAVTAGLVDSAEIGLAFWGDYA